MILPTTVSEYSLNKETNIPKYHIKFMKERRNVLMGLMGEKAVHCREHFKNKQTANTEGPKIERNKK